MKIAKWTGGLVVATTLMTTAIGALATAMRPAEAVCQDQLTVEDAVRAGKLGYDFVKAALGWWGADDAPVAAGPPG